MHRRHCGRHTPSWLTLLVAAMLGACGGSDSTDGHEVPGPPAPPGPVGRVWGEVLGDTTLQGLPGVTVRTSAGGPATSTDSFGEYLLEGVPLGVQTLAFTLEGYAPGTATVEVTGAGTDDAGQVVLAEIMQSDWVRVVLRWAYDPAALHLHACTPAGEHVYFLHLSGDGIALYRSLVDAVVADTFILRAVQPGTYTFFVQTLPGQPPLSDSGASVEALRGYDTLATLPVPPGSGSDAYWTVFTLTDGELAPVNTFAAGAPACVP